MEEVETLEYIILEDGKKYYITNEKDNYVLLTEENNAENFCIRKNVIRDGNEYIESLNSNEEFNEALKLFVDIHE